MNNNPSWFALFLRGFIIAALIAIIVSFYDEIGRFVFIIGCCMFAWHASATIGQVIRAYRRSMRIERARYINSAMNRARAINRAQV